MLHHYQLQVIMFVRTTLMAPISVDKCDVAPNPKKFKKSSNYVKINKTTNIVDDQVVTASQSATASSSIFRMNHKFTPLFESLHSIMTTLVGSNIITLPSINPLFPSTTSSPNFNS